MADLMMAAFAFLTLGDPMNDQVVYEARLGTRDKGVSVFCRQQSRKYIRLEFRPGRRIYKRRGVSGEMQYRFDDRKAVTVRPLVFGDRRTAEFVGKDALDFVEEMQASSRLRVAFRSLSGDPFLVDYDLDRDKSALAKVVASCADR